MSNTVDKARVIASYFGFEPASTPVALPPKKDVSPELMERLAILSHFEKSGLTDEPQPVLIAYERPIKKSPIKKERGHVEIGLEVIGSADASAEGVMFATTESILKEAGYRSLVLHINSMGDKESTARAERELSNYVRRNMNSLSREVRELAKKDVWSVLSVSDTTQNTEFFDNAPQTLNALSETSRTQFTSVIEYVEASGIPYVMDPRLVLPKEYAMGTIATFYDADSTDKKRKPLASIFRYNHISKTTELKKEIPALTGILSFKPKWKNTKPLPISKFAKPQLFFVQLGKEAKIVGIELLRLLAESHIPVAHGIMRDKITAQMTQAERLHVPYILLMGQREAIDRVVVLRNMVTRSQESIKHSSLVETLRKKLKEGK